MSKLVSLKLYQSIFLKEQIRLRFSVDLDFSDSKNKSLIYYSWRTENNVPDFSNAIINIGSKTAKAYTSIFKKMFNLSCVIISMKFIAIPNASISKAIT